ncbi:MAG: hypothetical protein ACTHMM_18280 [Agriterribacter sp.]
MTLTPKENQLVQGLRSARKVGLIGQVIHDASRSSDPEIHRELIKMMRDQKAVAYGETLLIIGRDNMKLLDQL